MWIKKYRLFLFWRRNFLGARHKSYPHLLQVEDQMGMLEHLYTKFQKPFMAGMCKEVANCEYAPFTAGMCKEVAGCEYSSNATSHPTS